MQSNAYEVAKALLEIGAVGFTPRQPVTFKSGIISPIYVDNRILPYHPPQWQKVISGFVKLVTDHNIHFDVIAGIEAAGIPHSAALGYVTQRPSVFVRKAAKEHGQKRQIEGGEVAKKQVLLIEDMVTTGGSSLRGVTALRAENAVVSDCMAIISYDLPEAKAAFAEAQVTLHTLTTFPVVLDQAEKSGLLSGDEVGLVRDWLDDPHGWAAKYGFGS